MKIRRVPHSLAIWVMVLPLGFASAGISFCATQDAGVILLEEGDTLSNGWTVDRIGYHLGMSASGSWAALVHSTEPGTDSDSVIVLDGHVILAEGDTLPDGDTLKFLSAMSMDETGTLGLAYRCELSATGANERRVQIGSQVVLREDQPLVAAGAPNGFELTQFHEVELALPFALVNGQARNATGSLFDVALLLDFSSGGMSAPPVMTLLANEGAAPAALPWPIASVSSRGDVATDGSYAVIVSVDDAGFARDLIRTNSGWIAVPGTASPAPGQPWSGTNGTGVQVGLQGELLIAGSVGAPGFSYGIIASTQDGILALQGQSFPLEPSSTVADVDSNSVAMTPTGERAYVVSLGGFIDILVHGSEIVLREGVSTVSGQVITQLWGSNARFELGHGGEAILAVAEHAGSDSSLILVERSIGSSTACLVTANTAGTTGSLSATGSSYASANNVTLTARNLPVNAFGYLLTSSTPDFTPLAGGSAGNLCLGGEIGRFVGQVQSSGMGGRVLTAVDLTALPQPTGAVVVTPGSTWLFQLWHRDTGSGTAPSSNFTESVSVQFR